MRGPLSSVAAVLAGLVVWVLVAYAGAVVALLAMFGIPLGSDGREPSAGEYAVLLLVGMLGAFAGGRVASRFASAHRAASRLILPAIIAGTLVWGFSKESSNWPDWWGPVFAAVSAVGASMGSASRALQRKRTS